jgi:hypothetical protein
MFWPSLTSLSVLKRIVALLTPARILFQLPQLRQHLALNRARAKEIRRFHTFATCRLPSTTFKSNNVLIDATWDNANYWFRYSLFRQALSLAFTSETGLIGPYSRKKISVALKALKITKTIDFQSLSLPKRSHFAAAKSILSSVSSPKDLLHTTLHNEFPPSFLYDQILKWQRRGTIDLCDPNLLTQLATCLAQIEAADRLFQLNNFDIVVLSHAIGTTYAGLAWAALNRNIPVYILYGDYGLLRYAYLSSPSDLYSSAVGRPSKKEINSMAPIIKEKLVIQGRSYLKSRLSGGTNDIGSQYAYKRRLSKVTKEKICTKFNWDPSKPIVGVYNSNWFDYPHACGLESYSDFQDWILQTLAVARTQTSFNWLFKPHPCDDWYKSIKGQLLEDIVSVPASSNIALADKSWNGYSLIDSLDAIITCHGTIGIEATACKKPVLVPYSGWYGHAGFVSVATGVTDYLGALRTKWWASHHLEELKYQAELFAGWMFCMPSWQNQYRLNDDSAQDGNYSDYEYIFNSCKSQLSAEVEVIQKWVLSRHPYLHIYKMSISEEFISPS